MFLISIVIIKFIYEQNFGKNNVSESLRKIQCLLKLKTLLVHFSTFTLVLLRRGLICM
jgi:hypothetical protein